MDLTISSQESIRILSKILTFSSKISDTLQLTPQPPSLSIRVLNSSQSAFTNFKLCPSFFATCRFTTRTPQKLPVKALLPIFRTPANINIIHITTPPLTITVNTKTVIKTFTPPLQEGRVPAIASTEPLNRIVTTAPFLQNLLQNFHTRLDEITIIPSPDSLRLVSFLDDAGPANLMLRTEMTVSSRELDEHQYTTDTPVELTLFYRPFRAAIDFCEAFEEPLTIAYDQPGVPVSVLMDMFTDSGEVAVQSRFVFASRLADEGVVRKRGRLSTQVRDESQATPRTTQRGIEMERAQERVQEAMREREGEGESLGGVVESSGVVEATQEMHVSRTPALHVDPPVDDDDEYDDDDDDFVEGTPPPEE